MRKQKKLDRYYFVHAKIAGNIYRDIPIGVCIPTPAIVKQVFESEKLTHGYLGYIENHSSQIVHNKKYPIVVTQELYRGHIVRLLNHRMTTMVH